MALLFLLPAKGKTLLSLFRTVFFLHSLADDFTCRDVTNKVVIRCEGKAASAGSDIKGYDASTGDLLFHLEEIFFRVTKTFLIKDPRGKVPLSLRFSV